VGWVVVEEHTGSDLFSVNGSPELSELAPDLPALNLDANSGRLRRVFEDLDQPGLVCGTVGGRTVAGAAATSTS
jgi:hypothetical protein